MVSVSFVVILLCGCATSSYLGYRIRPDYPKSESESLVLPGLIAPVNVHLDTFGIPHIEAENEQDLLRATGYMQARQRFFAMDGMRRLARGRISELVGKQPLLGSNTVELDKSMRGWGFDRGAEDDAAALEPELRALLTAYVEGVNTALARYRPLEYRLLRVEPEPWQLADTFAIGRLNAWSVTHNWHQELSRFLLALHGGVDRSMQIYGHEPWDGMTSIPGAGEPAALAPAIAPELRELLPARARPRERPEEDIVKAGSPAARLAASVAAFFGGASNAWVVAGDRSASGRPLLASDPHLTHMLPSLFYQQSLRAPGIAIIGAGIAGIPYVLTGHNGRVAWGITSSVADTQDLFVELPDGPESVRTKTGSAPIEREDHVIRVRDGRRFKEISVTFRRTPTGLLMNDIYPALFPPDAPLVALRSVPVCNVSGVEALRRAAKAEDVHELRAALITMESPSQVWQAIDDGGRIALFLTGRLPRRDGYRGTFPMPAWTGAYGWDGVVPDEEMPFVVAETGFLAHANNPIVDIRRDTHVGVDSAPSYRQERIMALLEARERHSADDLRLMQLDVFVERGRRIAPRMLESLQKLTLAPLAERAVAVLADWDYDARADSAGAALFFTIYRHAILLALEDELDGPGFDFILAQRYSTNVADLWFDDEHHPVWDDRRTPQVETRTAVLAMALEASLADLTAAQGDEPEAFRWGVLHDLEVRHLFGGQRALKKYMNLPRAEVGGALDSIWKSHFDLGHPEHPFRAVAGPILRLVVDAADFDAAGFVLDTGNTGWPGCPHYRDQNAVWLRGELVPMSLDRKAVVEGAAATLTFVPE